MPADDTKKYILIALLLLSVYLSFLVIKPIFYALLWALVLAYLFTPIYRIVNKKIRNERASSLLITSAIVILTVVLATAIVSTLSNEILITYSSVKESFDPANLEVRCQNPDLVCKVADILSHEQINPTPYINQAFSKLMDKIVEQTSNLAFSIPGKVVELFIVFFVMYYLFINGESFLKSIASILPMDKKHKEQIVNRVSDVVGGVVYGHILTALIVGVVGTIGFSMFNMSSPVLLGFLVGLAAFVPGISTTVIWLPVAVYQFLNGFYSHDKILMAKGVGILLFGIFALAYIDNIIRAKLIGDRARVHPAIVLICAFGGLLSFGFIGIFIGPLIITVFITLVEIYGESQDW